jgi:phosphoribosylformylglycinamidine (FGAM) synthase-like enzyme
MGAGTVRIKDTDRALALSTDCNARFVYLDPYLGAQLAVAEAARNVACAGALPIGATNCLNFGNPQRPDIMPAAPSTSRSPAATSACTTKPTGAPCFRHPYLASSACWSTRTAS